MDVRGGCRVGRCPDAIRQLWFCRQRKSAMEAIAGILSRALAYQIASARPWRGRQRQREMTDAETRLSIAQADFKKIERDLAGLKGFRRAAHSP